MKELIMFGGMIAIWLSAVGGFVQHIITCVHNEAVFLLTLGVILPPIGVLHGWGVWLGIFG